MPQVIHTHRMQNASPTACHSERFLNPTNSLATVFDYEFRQAYRPHFSQPFKESIFYRDGPEGFSFPAENPYLFLFPIYIRPAQLQ